jgi:hypothetical protein
MQQKFNLEVAGRLLGISSSAMRARAKKDPEKYQLERDNRGKIWVWLDPATLPELKPAMQPAKAVALQAQPDELKAALQAIQEYAQAAAAAADLQGKIDALSDDLVTARQAAAVADAERRAAVVLADERARALEAAERNLADLRRLLPAPAGPLSPRSWWRFWS